MKPELFWKEWKRLTQFLESTRIALRREDEAWKPLHTASEAAAKIVVQDGPSTFEVDVASHRATVQDISILCSLVLVHSYGLVERAVETLLDREKDPLSGGIECWATKVLNLKGNSWDAVMDGKAGLVEVAVFRNQIAHGSYEFDETSCHRLNAVGANAPVPGMPLVVDYLTVDLHRARLKSFLRVAGYNSAGACQ